MREIAVSSAIPVALSATGLTHIGQLVTVTLILALAAQEIVGPAASGRAVRMVPPSAMMIVLLEVLFIADVVLRVYR